MEIKSFKTGDVLVMKKNHPCGTNRFRVFRTGSDIRLKCEGCGRDMTVRREKIEKSIKEIYSAEV